MSISQLRHRAVRRAFEYLFGLHIRTDRAFTVPNEIIGVRAVAVAITDVTQSPTSRTGLAGDEHRIVGHEPIVVVLHVHVPSQCELFEIVRADDGLGSGSGARQS